MPSATLPASILFASVLLAAAVLSGCPQREAEGAKAPASSAQILLGDPSIPRGGPTPRLADGHPSFTGYWKVLREDGRPDGNLGKDLPGFELPYSKAGRAALEFNRAKTIDPEARCLITGVPRLVTSVLPFEILHTPQRIGLFYYLGWHRFASIDGRTLPAAPDPHYLGNSAARWEGDTLVIESRGFEDSADGQFWLDDNANPQSREAQLTERWTRPDLNHLRVELLYEDPAYYTAPVSYTRTWVLAPAGEALPEFSCEWNTPWVLAHLEPGPGHIGADGNRGFGPDGAVVPELPLGAVDDSRGTGYWLYRRNKPKPSDLPTQ